MRWKSMKPIGSAGASTASKPNCARCRRVSDRRSRTSHPIARANSASLEGPDSDARSEEHTSELQSLMLSSHAVFSLTQITNEQNISNGVLLTPAISHPDV